MQNNLSNLERRGQSLISEPKLPPDKFRMTPEQHLRRAEVLAQSSSPKAKELAQHHRNLAKIKQRRQDQLGPTPNSELDGSTKSAAHWKRAYEEAKQELIRLGYQEPRGDAYPKCIFDALIGLAAAFPLFLLIGRRPEDLAAMWVVVIGIGIVSYVVRWYTERAWLRDYERRARFIAEQMAMDELRAEQPRGK